MLSSSTALDKRPSGMSSTKSLVHRPPTAMCWSFHVLLSLVRTKVRVGALIDTFTCAAASTE